MPTNQTDIERIKQSFRECAELAIFHRNRKGGEDTPVSLSPYDVTTLLADHDLKVEQLRAARAVIEMATHCFMTPNLPNEYSPSEIRGEAKAYLARYPERSQG